MYRDWQVVCAIKDDLLRLLVSTAKDEEILAGLQRGFPEFFSNQPTKLRVPASALREAARVFSRQERNPEDTILRDGELFWNPVLEHFGIPFAFRWQEGDVPQEVLDQLVGQPFGSGMKVSYHNRELLVVGIDELVGTIGKKIDQPLTDVYFLATAAAEFIDLDA